MSDPQLLLEGVAFGESPLWHDGRLWFSDWGAQEVVAVDEVPGGEFAPGTLALVSSDGTARQVADGLAFPNGIAITSDERTLIVAESSRRG